MRISIIVNNYNYEAHLGEAIDSALAQTHPDVEVVVVDDGSTDGSRQVIERYGERVKPVFKENGGQGSAFNAGFSASSGGGVIFLDADDVLKADVAEAVASALADADTSKVTWQLAVIGPEGRENGQIFPEQPPDAGDLLPVLRDQGPFSFRISPTSGNGWSRAFLKRVMPMPTEALVRNADAYLLTLSPVFGQAVRIATPMSYYRIHGSNAFAGKSAYEAMDELEQQYAILCDALDDVLTSESVDHDRSRWRQAYWEQLRQLCAAVEAIVPPDAHLLLVDQDQLNMGDSFFGRRRRHLMEKDGRYWGPPANGAEAVRQLTKLREEGVRYAAFTSDARWWLDHYGELRRYLKETGRMLWEDDAAVIYGL